MAPRRRDSTSAVVKTTQSARSTVDTAKAARAAQESQLRRVPSPVRFLLVVFNSLLLSSVLFTLTSRVTLGELGHVSKHLEEWWEVGGLMVWKAVEVGLAWVLGFDGRDVMSFTFLTHLPTYSLLSSFYGVRPTTILASYAISLVSTAIPFVLLRRPSSVHNLPHAPSDAVSNRAILQDRPTAFYTTVAAAAIYSVALYLSYASWLPAYLVVHFENIPDIRAVHAGPAGLPALFITLLPAGWAARDFLFVSSTGASNKSSACTSNSEDEYLACAIYRQTWGAVSPKTRVLVLRTALLASVVILNTVFQVAGTVKGVDVCGATMWGAIWGAATLAIGGVFGWIEAVDGV
ncbi:uncharacterized protein ACLA_038710 [Aspergillus clavatus NRRL 1]|uniref:Uncharacterized protein n=1 Tax=Aspergillus clavatus (strain ATCC 1007 / CBS 513.65 / DSM 816 / NCTC 3887 / NRRL 1 / QM 1276 / 107) TaxID=344612 RepID=A1CKI2_ASPCL|nr:uncharacterized protein ACLA_038710 [Aspergillus clavatus NRRL 1]EAW09656.1 conserved hypothetical protein [Aspergillus clavatus NRRL 1]